jgi:hypothetical protein
MFLNSANNAALRQPKQRYAVRANKRKKKIEYLNNINSTI